MAKPNSKAAITNSFKQTQELAKELAIFLKARAKKEKNAQVVGLIGELGSGKTTFIQGLAKGLGIKEKITSPTFVLLKKYQTQATRYRLHVTSFYHLDCYRLKSAKDLPALGFEEIRQRPKTVVLIEWAEKVKKQLPPNTLFIKFEYLDKNKRKISYENFSFN